MSDRFVAIGLLLAAMLLGGCGSTVSVEQLPVATCKHGVKEVRFYAHGSDSRQLVICNGGNVYAIENP